MLIHGRHTRQRRRWCPRRPSPALTAARGTVWTVEDGRLARRLVSFGYRTEDSRLEIVAGLPDGALVVS